MRPTPVSKRSTPAPRIAPLTFLRDLNPVPFHRSTPEFREHEISVTSLFNKRAGYAITCRDVVQVEVDPLLTTVGLDRVRLCNIGTAEDPYHVAKRLVVHEDRITVYNEPLAERKRTEAQRSAERHLSRGRYNGFISPSTARILRKRLEGWINCIIHNATEAEGWTRPKHSKLSFITLTLPAPQMHSDQELRREALDRFILDLKRKAMVQEYFWKAEAQENGNVHYHLLVDRYCSKALLDQCWSKQMERLGYLQRFRDQHGEKVAPMVQVKVCPSNMSLVQYVMKYVTKRPIKLPSFNLVDGVRVKTSRYWVPGKDQDGVMRWKHCRPISGRVWGCSDGVREVGVFTPYLTYRTEDFLINVDWLPEFRKVELDHCVLYFGPVANELREFDPDLYADYVNHHLANYRKLYPREVHPPPRLRSDEGWWIRKRLVAA